MKHSTAPRHEDRFAVGYSGRACGKEVSEDFFDMACPSPKDREARGSVLALADGVSGGSGRRAAETCVRTVLCDFYATPLAWDVARRLDRVIGALNAWLAAHNVRATESQCMLSTLSVLVLHGARIHAAHVGDSRIYRLRQGTFEQITRDHSLVNLYEENPELAIRFGPPNSNVIVRAVGLRDSVEVDHRKIALEPGDIFLLCCDGLTDMVDDWMLKEMLLDGANGSLDECCDTMVRAALSNGGVDNTTVVLVRVSDA